MIVKCLWPAPKSEHTGRKSEYTGRSGGNESKSKDLGQKDRTEGVYPNEIPNEK